MSNVRFTSLGHVKSRRLSKLWRVRPDMDQLELRTVPTVTVGVHLTGITGANSNCGCQPPDTNAAAGPSNVVELVNSAMQIINKNGTVVSTTPLATFFSSLSPSNLSDPVVLYDEAAARFFVGVLDYTSTSAPDSFDFAVSNTSDATQGFTEMHKVNVGEGSFFADYPRLGVNADAYFVSFNMFSASGGSYDHPQLFTIQKSSVTDQNNSTLVTFHHDQNSGLFTIDPAVMHGAAAGGPEYFVTEAVTANQVDVIKETNVLSNTPTDQDNNMAVTAYNQPPAANQPSGTITTNDSRMLNAAWRNNVLAATQTVGTGSTTTAHVRWYQFSTTSSPTLVQSGEINPGSGVATFFPSIDIDTAGDFGMTYMESSRSEFVSMYVTGRTPNDPAGTMETGVKTSAGTTNYTGSRAGDFSGTSVDPSTGTSFWGANEFINNSSGASWATGVANFSVTSIDHLSVSAPSTAAAGAAFSITVTALTSGNSADPNYRGTIHFTSSDLAAVLPGDYTFTAADAGAHTFTSGGTLKTAGNQTVTATDTASSGGATAGSAAVTVSPGAASQLAFGQQPTNATANATISPAPTVRVLDAFGNLETTDNTDQVTMAIGTNPAGGTLSGTLTVTASGGVATFSTLSINNPGNGYTLTAGSGALTGATSNGFNITPAVATHFSVTGPSSSTAGTAFSITVSALDAGNHVVTSYAGTVTFTSTDGQAALPANYSFAPGDAGVHTFTNGVTLDTAGNRSVTATDTVTSSINGSLTVNVSPAAATQLVFGQQPTNAAAGATISPAVTVRVLDPFGNLETTDNTDSVSMAIGANPGGGTLSGPNPVTASGGIATFSNLSINNSGNGYTLVASSGSLSSANSNAFNVTPTVATHFSVTGPSSSTAGTAFSITVTALDSSNHVVPTYTGTVTFTSTDVQALLPGNYTFNSGDAGAHTFTNGVTLDTAGNRSVTATDTVSSSITGSLTVAVNPAAPSKLVFGQQPTNVVAGASISPAVTVKVLDPFGNLETADNSDQISMAIGTNPAGGNLSGTNPVTVSGGVATFSNLSINNAGTGYTLAASSGSLSGATSNAFNVTSAVQNTPPVVTYQANQIIGGNTAVGNSGFSNVSGLSITLTSGADNVRISGSLGAYNKNTGAYNFLYARILVDGVVQGGPYGFTLSEATSTYYVETFNFESDVALAAGTHTIVVQATSSSSINVVWDPGTNQTLRVADYHTFTSSGSDVSFAQANANEGLPPTFGFGGRAVTNGSFATVPGLSTTLTTSSTDTVHLAATLSVDNNTLNFENLLVRFVVDGTATAAQTFWITPDAGPDTFRTFQLETDFANLAAGTHTISVQAETTTGRGLWFDGGSRSVPGGGGTANFYQTLRVTDYKTIPNGSPSGSSGWVSVADVTANDSGALASTYTNVPGLTSTFTLNATGTVRLAATLNVFNSSTTAYGLPAAHFLIDGVTATTGNSWNVNIVDSTNDTVEEELVFEDFVTLSAGTHTVTVQVQSTSGSVSFESASGSNQTLHVAAFQQVSGTTVPQPALAAALAYNLQLQADGLFTPAFGPGDDASMLQPRALLFNSSAAGSTSGHGNRGPGFGNTSRDSALTNFFAAEGKKLASATVHQVLSPSAFEELFHMLD